MPENDDEELDARTDRDIMAGDPNTSEQPTNETESDDEAQRIAAEQTASTSKNADKAGKDWNGDPSDAPEPL